MDLNVELSIVVTGMHLCFEFGNTYREIEADGYEISKKIYIQEPGDSPSGMSKTMGNALIKFSDFFGKNRYDLLIVLGDRHEIMAVCCAATNERIPIAHIHGGETTEGAVDECYRHCITKMSALHFVSCEDYRKRVIQLGEHPGKVHNVGALCVENALNTSFLTITELENAIGLTLSGKPYAVVTFHPATLEENTGAKQLRELMLALDAFPNMYFVITKANSDAGGREINSIWEDYVKFRKNCILVASLGMKKYLSALKYSMVMIGNSSSGILEGPTFKIPTVNIGDRQKGRIKASSIISCSPTSRDIKIAVDKALSPEFQKLAQNVDNPYGNGNASKKIVDVIRQFTITEDVVKKSFYDIDYDEKSFCLKIYS